jgi:GT2 family glycosyltransferase
MNCSVVILNYNGLEHLKTCIPSILKAVEQVQEGCPVVVVDNRSTDGSVVWLKQYYEMVEIVVAERNDYLFSLNSVIESRNEDIIIILNNDMHFDDKFISVLLPHFEDPKIFAVAAQVLNWDGTSITAAQLVGEIRCFWFYKQWKMEREPCLTLSAGGGCAAFRRDMFIELGGFDPLYRPAYWEDNDLSYRAWKRGMKIIYEPSSIIYHRVGATLDETEGGRPAVTRLIRRNEVLFTLRNVGGWGFVLGYLGLLPVRMVRNLLVGNHAMWRGALQALPRVPKALARRRHDEKTRVRDDADFLVEIKQAMTIPHTEGADAR